MRNREINYGIQTLRAIAAIMVITAHVAADFVTANINEINMAFSIANFYDAFSRISLPIFILISGGFILNNYRNSDYKLFYKKNINTIIVTTLIWSLIYVLYKVAIGYLRGNIDIGTYLMDWAKGEPYYHLWYLYMMIGMYLVTPFLIKLLNKINIKSKVALATVFLCIGFFMSISKNNIPWIFKFLEFIGCYISGGLIKNYYDNNKTNPKKFIYLSILSSLMVAILTELSVRRIIEIEDVLYWYKVSNPIVTFGGICLYIGFLNIKNLKLRLDKIAVNSFNIYLIHVGLWGAFGVITQKIFKLDYSNPIIVGIYIPIAVGIILISSYTISICIEKVRKTLKKMLENSYKNEQARTT